MWHEQCNWAQYNTSISNDIVMKVWTKARKVTRTPPVNKSSTFQSFGRVTGDRFHKQRSISQTTYTRWRQVTRCVGHDIALLSRVRGDFKPPRFALHRVHGGTKQRIRTARSAQETQTRIRTTQSAGILELQIEMDKLEFLAEFAKRARCEAAKRTTPTDDV